MRKERFAIIKFDMMEELDLNYKELLVLNYIDGLCKSGVKEYCFASNRTLCDDLRLSERTLYRVLKSLEQKSLITRKTKSIGHDGKERRIFSNVPSDKTADIYT